MSRVPSTYLDADGRPPLKLGDGRAAFAGARLVWDSLSDTMRYALIAVQFDPVRGAWVADSFTWSSSTIGALEQRGLVNSVDEITPLGLLVREVGTRTTEDSDA